MQIGTVTDEDWEHEVLNVDEIVIIAICSTHSDTCDRFRRVLEDIAGALEGVATVLSIDIDHNPAAARRYDVSSLPTLLVFRDGDLAGRLVGGRVKERLLAELSSYLH